MSKQENNFHGGVMTDNIIKIIVEDIVETDDVSIINEAIEDDIDIEKEACKIKRIFKECYKKIIVDKVP